ncbi:MULTISPECIES: rhodanese-like domain-containing protein [unclassified Nocardioides]|jgi:rhodanese-related sulfurtransferase|uniref:rhodanese-like domain-containing protein n=1 Tax=unclassified Nocardioides TaxID=2615069 RepID=UPI00070380F0|nr:MULTISPECIES: rhodanese-like domain-containing protein [unclassified Nocardioides]KRC53167.1 sulfurtransferase [Nocardioides sp. Root79]KRC72695.1 sulfurtransferase [Nocardioides sp. Root240]
MIPTIEIENVPDPLPEGLLVLDVREDDEWAAAHIEGAVHIPLMELPARLGEFVELEAPQTLVVCKAGGRSQRAAAYLAQQGYDVVNLIDGMIGWERAGRAMVSDTGQPAVVI